MGLRILKDIDTAKTTLVHQTFGEVLTNDRHQIIVMIFLFQFLHLLLELVKRKFKRCQFHTAASSPLTSA